MKRLLRPPAAVTALAMLLSLCACGAAPADEKTAADAMCPENDIISYEPVDTEKTIITVGNYMNVNIEPIEAALEALCPDIEIVSQIGNGYGYLTRQASHGELPDIIFFYQNEELSEYFYDLSSEEFTNRYNLSSLNALSIDSRIYQLPVASSGNGIFYNKTLFDENGWEIPETLDEFYALCDRISAAGIRPFAPCFKYAGTVSDVGLGLSNREIFGDVATAEKFYEFADGSGSAAGVMEPFITALRGLYERGLINEGDFSSSVTQIRRQLYAGEVAMVPYSMTYASFYDEEKPDCELGFMGYPTDSAGRWYMSVYDDVTCVSLSDRSMQDAEKRDILLGILDYLSTDEGQEVLFRSFTGISSLKSYQSTVTSRFEEAAACIDGGLMYFPEAFWENSDLPEIEEIITGNMTMEEMTASMDAIRTKFLAPEEGESHYGVVSENFSLLETSEFIADCFRETTGADIALVLNSVKYKGTTMKLYAGEDNYDGSFYIRGLSGDNCLTVYEITGANLKLLTEHPVVDGEEINAMYAPSGLSMTYAPWTAADRNVKTLTLSDGTQIDDEAVYTVAAWDTSIDERYISSVKEIFTEYNDIVIYMSAELVSRSPVSPPKDGRITLDWESR